ncbi:hypothetical protein L2703_16330 [Shewanella basaltis]|uniref:hypothetical protein n=1 Tax=Shewanella basaltis TaxID=472183 RepID=UPI0020105F5B|nr:hypothetical protein [Shewanella basaltis]MCL1115147.1 hypothetical protein [Shewanella basaltis]
MKRINILIVEDQQSHIDQWKNAIIEFNLLADRDDKKIEFSCEFAESYGKAKKLLKTFNFSAAIIDIRLAEDDGKPNENNTKGNDVLLDIVKSTMCLAWVYTGQRTDADIPAYLEEYIELIDRAAQSKSELLETLESKRDIIDSIIEIKHQFSQSKAEHFYSAIWPRWSLWGKDGSGYADKAIIRHMATHLHASFLNEAEKVHPEEYYFTGPMIKGNLDTGDITQVDGTHYILVTPRCEIAQKKNSYYQFVKLEDKYEELQQEKTKLGALEDLAEQKKTSETDCNDVVQQLSNTYEETVGQTVTQRRLVKQALRKKASAEDEELAEINATVISELEKLFELEEAEKKAETALKEAQRKLEFARESVTKADKNIQKQQSKVSKLLPNNGVKISLHILPEIKRLSGESYGPLHAQFEQLTYVNKTDTEMVERYISGKYARLSNEFVPSFVERLGSHFSRIGTPDYSHPE